MSLRRRGITFIDAAMRELRERVVEGTVVAGLHLRGECLYLTDVAASVRHEPEHPARELVVQWIIEQHRRAPFVSWACPTSPP